MSIMMVLVLLLAHECANVWLDVMVRSKYCHYYPHYYAHLYPYFATCPDMCYFDPIFTPFGHTPENTPKYPPKQAPDPPTQAQIGYFQFMFIFCEDFDPFLGLPPKTTPDRPQNHPFLVNFWCFPRVPQIPQNTPIFDHLAICCI